MVLIRRAVAAALVLVGLVVGAPAEPARAAPAETGRYYVVGPPVGGQREYLYDIALRTLGNGNRYREIVELNEGRSQPDGETFTDGLVLNPGWILVLPADAKGQGVRIGRLPNVPVRSPRPAPATTPPTATRPSPPPQPAAPSSAAPSTAAPSTAAPARSPSATTRTDTGALAQPVQGRRPNVDPVDPLLVRGGAGLLAVFFAAVALMLLRRRIGARRGALALTDDGPWPPQRHHTPTPAELAAGSRAGTGPPPQPESDGPPAEAIDRAASAGPPPAGPGSQAALPPAPAGPPPGPTGPPGPAGPPPGPAGPSGPAGNRSAAGRRPAGPPAAPPRPGRPTSPNRGGVRPGAAPTPAPARPAGQPTQTQTQTQTLTPVSAHTVVGPPAEQLLPTPELPRPTVPSGDEVPYLSAELETEAGPLRVRLVGVAAGRGSAPAYAWLGDEEPAPPATLPLVLGHQGPWRLHVDLGRAPDVLTLVGPVDDCRRTAVLLARRLRTAGIGVAVVGPAFGTDAPDGSQLLDALPQPPAPGEDLPKPYVVFTAGLSPEDTAGARSLAAATGGRCVPVLTGPVPAGRWSIQVGSDAGAGTPV